jgi:hypothetical protein
MPWVVPSGTHVRASLSCGGATSARSALASLESDADSLLLEHAAAIVGAFLVAPGGPGEPPCDVGVEAWVRGGDVRVSLDRTWRSDPRALPEEPPVPWRAVVRLETLASRWGWRRDQAGRLWFELAAIRR